MYTWRRGEGKEGKVASVAAMVCSSMGELKKKIWFVNHCKMFCTVYHWLGGGKKTVYLLCLLSQHFLYDIFVIVEAIFEGVCL